MQQRSEILQRRVERQAARGHFIGYVHQRRAILRAELDAYYAHLYSLERDELRYILDPSEVMGDAFPSLTFPGLKRKELERYGEYRTQRLVLEAYDSLITHFKERSL